MSEGANCWQPIASVPPDAKRAWLRDYQRSETIGERSRAVHSGWVQAVTRKEVHPVSWANLREGEETHVR